MNILVAMSGGVDSSVAASLLLEAGHAVTGCTMKLWGGQSDTGCCSVADVDDARRVAQQLDIHHVVFGFGDDFAAGVVDPYVAAHAAGRTPNPCIECNRTIKFHRLLQRAHELGFDAVATGHHARVERAGGGWSLRRGADPAKDQSYVLHMLGQAQLARTVLPVGHLTKGEVRARASELGLRTASKPDSQDVCFIQRGRRRSFLEGRLPMTPGRLVDSDGNVVGAVDAIELVTVGQRRGLGLAGGGAPRFATSVDPATGTVTVGAAADLLVDQVTLEPGATWVADPPSGRVEVQCSAHGEPRSAYFDPASGVVSFDEPRRKVAPGQSVVLYRGDEVLGGGVAA